jgi:uncharacterized protein (DUF2141 family)
MRAYIKMRYLILFIIFASNLVFAGKIEVRVKNIKNDKGFISLGLYDENSNIKLDQNFIGIPKEGYGFSNNAESMVGPPRFKKCMFNLREKIKLDINLKY